MSRWTSHGSRQGVAGSPGAELSFDLKISGGWRNSRLLENVMDLGWSSEQTPGDKYFKAPAASQLFSPAHTASCLSVFTFLRGPKVQTVVNSVACFPLTKPHLHKVFWSVTCSVVKGEACFYFFCSLSQRHYPLASLSCSAKAKKKIWC